jgi:hypothetical protein
LRSTARRNALRLNTKPAWPGKPAAAVAMIWT